jgi:hypothetical protein
VSALGRKKGKESHAMVRDGNKPATRPAPIISGRVFFFLYPKRVLIGSGFIEKLESDPKYLKKKKKKP